MGTARPNRSEGLTLRGWLALLAAVWTFEGASAGGSAGDSLRVDGRAVRVDALVAVDTLAGRQRAVRRVELPQVAVRGAVGGVVGGAGWATAWGAGVPVPRWSVGVGGPGEWAVAFGMVGTLVPWVDPAAVPDSCIGFLGASRDRALRAVVQNRYPLGIETDTVETAATGRWEMELRAGVARVVPVGERGLLRAGVELGRTLTPTVVQEFREPAPDATRAEAFPHRELAAGRWVPRVEVGLGRARDARAGCRAPRHSRPVVWAVLGFEAGTDGVPHRWTATVGWTLGAECRR